MIARKKASVQANRAVEGSLGEKKTVPNGPPVVIRVNTEPLDSSEKNELGLQLVETRRVIYRGRSWPADVRSVITIDGAQWRQHGPVERFDGTAGAASWQAVLKRIGANDGGG